MIRDPKAEALEAKGLYRRAAARWAEVMVLADDDKVREQAVNRRSKCIRQAASSSAKRGKCEKKYEAINQVHTGIGPHKRWGKDVQKIHQR